MSRRPYEQDPELLGDMGLGDRYPYGGRLSAETEVNYDDRLPVAEQPEEGIVTIDAIAGRLVAIGSRSEVFDIAPGEDPYAFRLLEVRLENDWPVAVCSHGGMLFKYPLEAEQYVRIHEALTNPDTSTEATGYHPGYSATYSMSPATDVAESPVGSTSSSDPREIGVSLSLKYYGNTPDLELDAQALARNVLNGLGDLASAGGTGVAVNPGRQSSQRGYSAGPVEASSMPVDRSPSNYHKTVVVPPANTQASNRPERSEESAVNAGSVSERARRIVLSKWGKGLARVMIGAMIMVPTAHTAAEWAGGKIPFVKLNQNDPRAFSGDMLHNAKLIITAPAELYHTGMVLIGAEDK